MASLRDDVAARCLETAGTSEIALSGVPGHTQLVSRYRALSSMILVGCLVFLLMCLQLVPHYLRRCPFAHHKMRNDRHVFGRSISYMRGSMRCLCELHSRNPLFIGLPTNQFHPERYRIACSGGAIVRLARRVSVVHPLR